MANPEIGTYVLATKYTDGDPGDGYGLGFYDGERDGRHYVKDGAGRQIRGNGFRRVEPIRPDVGRWLLEAGPTLERSPPGTVNLWTMLTPMAFNVDENEAADGVEGPEARMAEPQWIVNDMGELGVMVEGRAYFLYKGDNIEYPSGLHDDGTPILYRIVGKREFGETCQPLPHLRDKWPGGQGAKYLEPLVFTPGLSWGRPEDGEWKPLPTDGVDAAPNAVDGGM